MNETVVALIAEKRHLGNRALVDARSAFELAGCRVELVVPDGDRPLELSATAPSWDIALSRGRDLAGLGLLAAAAALGVPTVNTPRAIELVRNKVAMHAILQRYDVPLPRTWFATHRDAFRRLPSEAFPVVVKPHDGDGARGLVLLTGPDDVDLVPAPPRGRTAPQRVLYLAQRFMALDGWDLKLYGIGRDVWAVRKPSPVRFEGPGPARLQPRDGAELVPLDARLTDIALTCGRACGLELWGVDVGVTPDGPLVIEVNDFPTYSAVPGAGQAIARHTLALLGIHTVERDIGRDRLGRLVRVQA